MRRLDGIQLERADCERFAPAVAAAARRLHDTELAALAAALGAATSGQHVANPSLRGDDTITLTAWARANDIPARTARRWAASGKLPGAHRTAAGWLVSSATPPISTSSAPPTPTGSSKSAPRS